MTFIRKKKVEGRIYYYIVRNTLIRGKVKQKVLYYIGTAESLYEKLIKLKKKA